MNIPNVDIYKMRRRLAKWADLGPKVIVTVNCPAYTYAVHITDNIDEVLDERAATTAVQRYDIRTGKVSLATWNYRYWRYYHVVRTDGLPFEGGTEQYIYCFPCSRFDSAKTLQCILANLSGYTCTNSDPEDAVQTLMSMSANSLVDSTVDDCPREVCAD